MNAHSDILSGGAEPASHHDVEHCGVEWIRSSARRDGPGDERTFKRFVFILAHRIVKTTLSVERI